ncbi:MAG: penicillin-binding protein 1C [Rhodobiaceae bacterium]|nr:penicillin-binding protein 1C [Rhodobiaceae bacterium]
MSTRTKRRRALGVALAAALACAGLAGAGLGVTAWRVPDPVAAPPETARLVLDRGGALLHPFLTASGHWRLPVALDEVDPDYLRLLLAYEDKRYREHAGVDWRAVLRAAWQMATSGRIVSGASTLTMQVVRLSGTQGTRSLAGKFRQAVQALRLEEALGKDEILSRYLARAPYGGNIEGVRAASLAWFGKEPRHLTLAEAALLVALPQSPEARRPDRDPQAARAARDRVLARALAAGIASAAAVEHARGEPVPTARRDMPRHAPLTALAAIAGTPAGTQVRLTLDLGLQDRLEALALAAARRWGEHTTAAILVADNATGDIVARVDNAAMGDPARGGSVDMAGAIRSPGSALKPFVYAMAFEAGHVRPATLIDDRPTRFGGWAPENFSGNWRGTLSVREALQHSLNVPAVLLMERVGPATFAARLAASGHALSLPQGTRPGLPVILGGAGTTLEDLASLYAGLATGEAPPPLRLRLDDAHPPRPKPPFGREAARMVAAILREAPAPDNAASGRISFKTGTSYGYRDAWAIGFDRRTTIAVWIGRADGSAVPGLVGRDAAAPVLFDAFARLDRPIEPVALGEQDTATEDLPQPLRRFTRLAEPEAQFFATPPPAIAYPPDGARIELVTASGNQTATVPIRIAGGVPPFTVLADQAPIHRGARRTLTWLAPGSGFAQIVVVDAQGRQAAARIRIDETHSNGHVGKKPSPLTAHRQQ